MVVAAAIVTGAGTSVVRDRAGMVRQAGGKGPDGGLLT
jgi:hypothetical protein